MPYKQGDRVEVYGVETWMAGRIESEHPGYWIVRLDTPIPVPTSQMNPNSTDDEWIAWKSNPSSTRFLAPSQVESGHRVDEVAEAFYDVSMATLRIVLAVHDNNDLPAPYAQRTDEEKAIYRNAARKVIAALGRTP